jgi:raffinose/stachyose/melibiose transport system permease protein
VATLFIAPVLIVLINSFKTNTGMGVSFFSIPSGEFFAGIDNYVVGLTFGNYPFIKAFMNSVIVTITSTVLILFCTSMAAWYIARVGSKFTKLIYNLCIFSMIVPFQMVMYTLSKTADMFNFNTPFSISIIYLGFGAGLAIFMFTGFIKSIPIEIEEAAAIDGCNPLQTFFKVVLPICKPMFISVAILEIMWIWNDYLLPYLVLDRTKYMTIPVHIQYLQGSYGQVDLGATMAIITMCLIPIVIIYIVWQKHIIKGMIDGAVK